MSPNTQFPGIQPFGTRFVSNQIARTQFARSQLTRSQLTEPSPNSMRATSNSTSPAIVAISPALRSVAGDMSASCNSMRFMPSAKTA